MDKLPVGQLPDLASSNNDDEIMVITNSEYNQLKKEKISDLITDFTSTNENNALTKGTDGKLFVTDFGNASNITEGTLPTSVLPEIPLEKIPDIPKDKLPPIETSDLPVSGVTADTYAYPSSVTVNAQGMVTAIEEGSPSGANANTDLSNLTETGESHFANPDLSNLTAAGEKHFLNKTQITNCILEAPNGVATYSGGTITVKQGLKVLIPNGRNADGTLKNTEYTLQSDVSVSLPSDRNGVEFVALTNNGELSYWNTNDVGYIYKEPQSNLNWKYYDEDNNIYKYTINGASYVDSLEVPVLLANVTNGVINSLTPYQPVELLKRSDKAEIVSWSMPAYETYTAQEWNTVYQATEDRYVYYGGSAISNNSALLIRTPEGQPCGALYDQDNSWGIACYIAYSNNYVYTLIPKGYYYKAVNALGTTGYPDLGYVKLKGVL